MTSNKTIKRVVVAIAVIIVVTGFVFLFLKVNKFLTPPSQIEQVKDLPYH